MAGGQVAAHGGHLQALVPAPAPTANVALDSHCSGSPGAAHRSSSVRDDDRKSYLRLSCTSLNAARERYLAQRIAELTGMLTLDDNMSSAQKRMLQDQLQGRHQHTTLTPAPWRDGKTYQACAFPSTCP